MSDIIISRQGALGLITLNRPDALNALTHEMVQDMHHALKIFADDDAVCAVLVKGAGARGLCAGGDIRSIYDAQLRGDDLAARFWRDEYVMNAYIARYPKPYIAIMDGIVMGGGVGISAHGSHRIVTERSRAAMPETAIGFSPDVGGTFLLSRATGETGTFAGLTALPMNGGDAVVAGFADHHVPSAQLTALMLDLADCSTGGEIDEAIATRSTLPAPGLFASHIEWINQCFAFDTVENIIAALDVRAEPEAQTALAALARNCPKSLKVALRALRNARGLTQLEDCLQMEYHISLVCIAHPDMIEGIRAAVIDKDRKPRWSPARLDGVTEEMVAGYFMSRVNDEIKFSG